MRGVGKKGSAVMNRIKSSMSVKPRPVVAQEKSDEEDTDKAIVVPENAIGISSEAKSIDQERNGSIEPLEVEDTAAMEFDKKEEPEVKKKEKKKAMGSGHFGRINKKINTLLKTESLE